MRTTVLKDYAVSFLTVEILLWFSFPAHFSLYIGAKEYWEIKLAGSFCLYILTWLVGLVKGGNVELI